MSLTKSVYHLLFRRTSTFAITIMVGAVFFERLFDHGGDAIFEHMNRGVSRGFCLLFCLNLPDLANRGRSWANATEASLPARLNNPFSWLILKMSADTFVYRHWPSGPDVCSFFVEIVEAHQTQLWGKGRGVGRRSGLSKAKVQMCVSHSVHPFLPGL